jgi:hypothetical protein
MSLSVVVNPTKVCPRCQVEKPLSEFHKRSSSKDGRCRLCKPCHVIRNAIYRHANAIKVRAYARKHNKIYRRSSIIGFLSNVYTHMRNRVTGKDKSQNKIYLGLPILSRDEFYVWALEQKEFFRLFYRWQKRGYHRRDCPSINRLVPRLGYSAGNINWLPQHINASQNTRWTRIAESVAAVQHAA